LSRVGVKMAFYSEIHDTSERDTALAVPVE